MENWNVRYSHHVGDLTVFSEKIGRLGLDKRKTKPLEDDVFISYNVDTNELLMVEIMDAEKRISDIENLSREALIERVKEIINLKEWES